MPKIIKPIVASIVMYLSFIPASSAVFIDYGSYLADTRSGLDWMDITPTVGLTFNEVSQETRSGGRFEGWRIASAYPNRQTNGVWEMLRNWGSVPLATNNFQKSYSSDPDWILRLIEIMGTTARYVSPSNQPDFGPKRGQTVTELKALSADSFDYFGKKVNLALLQVTSNSRGTLNGIVDLFSGNTGRDYLYNPTNPDYGTFLIRDSINPLTLAEVAADRDNYELVRKQPYYYYRYTHAVPEPVPLALMVLGLAVLFLTRRTGWQH